MKIRLFTTILLLFPAITYFLPGIALGQDINYLDSLDSTIKNRSLYINAQYAYIHDVKQQLEILDISAGQQYQVYQNLFYAFKTFNCDSAFYYAEKKLKIAETLQKQDWIDESKLHLSSVFYIIGMYKEAFDLLNTLDKSRLTDYLKVQYYNNYKEIYAYYSATNNVYVRQYKRVSNLYRDTLLSVLSPETNHYRIVYAEKLTEEGKLSEAEKILNNALSRIQYKKQEFAVLNYALACVYREKGDIESAKMYFAVSADTDIRNAIKENAAMQALAILMYEAGDLNRAYEYIKCSLEDAIFCNARLRTIEISQIFPIIDTAYQEKIIEQKNQMKRNFLLTCVLSFFLIIAVGYVYRQMKKLAITRKELHTINLKISNLNNQLLAANDRLKKTNHRLFETNLLKEEYIGHFLDLCSAYIDKLESYRKMLFKKASASQWEALHSTLKSKDFIDAELKALYDHFDNIFLHLYPNFIEEFNQLLMEEERFVLKQGELLNPELRIFALIRLGINDSYKIAAFLHYSASTIYNYRTKVRNKAAVPRDDFENLVMKIGAFPYEKP
jgi:hypothetical protein